MVPTEALAVLSWGRQRQSSKCFPLPLHSLPDLRIPTTLMQRNEEQLTGLGIY